MRTPSARKSGRNPLFPYVPIIRYSAPRGLIEHQIKGMAFTSRAEAVAYAATVIKANDQKSPLTSTS